MVWLLCMRNYLLIFVFSTVIAVAVILPFDNYLIIDQQKDFFAYAHIFSDTPNAITKNFGKYQLVFLPYPNNPIANDNSTRLNFSLTENKTDVYSLFISLIIKDRNSGNVVEQIPYKFYEFGDITLSHIFQEVGDYIITFQAKIHGDPKYKVNPLIANFNLSVVEPSETSFIPWMLFLLPILAAIAGIVTYIEFFRKRKNGGSRNAYLVCIF
jgi:hypothetical protein